MRTPVQTIAIALSKEAGYDEIHPFWLEQAALAIAALKAEGYGFWHPVDEDADQAWYE